ncbi:thermonuclease family protein [Patulibacter sp.]|uniref:thermonuclease family protein n=1 Tax=Patulibacter sp. TaxID=1912859 RepID=UPI002720F4B9|nr:thermonuclease family protein [Patulibacter sp.]MDO9409257.1 thermonuclease family protein [Patulibacter sp.]
MAPAAPRPGPPPAVVVALAAVAGGFGATRLWPPGAEAPGGVAGRAVAALSVPGARARVVRTLDGDTARIAFRDDEGRATVTVRYLGVDTPETVHPDRGVECFGPEASHRNRDWATGRLVRVRFDVERVDPYGRLLAALTPVGWRRSLSERLVAEGLGRVLAIAPNGTDAPHLRRVQLRAQRVGRGRWGACGNALPSRT